MSDRVSRVFSSYLRCVVLAVVGVPALSVASASAGGALARGGSNYAWYKLDGCQRDPYGVIANYNTKSTLINQQLATMYQNGQRRLRIPIFHARTTTNGTVMGSAGGNISVQNRQNLTNFLAAVKNAGFQEIEVAFFPMYENSPASWGSQYSEDFYQENWNVIYNLHSIIASSGIQYKIDLLNEGVPATGQSALLRYDQHLWNDYNFVFGKNDTVGFSIIVDSDRLGWIDDVYGNSQYGNHGTPYLYDMHFYDNAATAFATAVSAMSNFPAAGWIVGEGYYNDSTEATDLSNAITSSGQGVFYLTQWPLTSAKTCSDVDVIPLAFSNYIAKGF